MRCEDYREALINGAEESVADAARAHLSACADCSQAAENIRSVRTGLRALADTTRDASAPASLEGRLLEEFQALHTRAVPVATGGRWRWAAAAAVLLVAGASLLMSFRRAAERVDVPQPVALVKETPPAPAAQKIVPQTTQAAAQTTRSVRQPRPGHPRVLHPEGFVPLPIAAGLPQFESGEIVRIEIPLMALPSYGVEVPPDAADKPVQADLLVGQDGQPRAIRLVTADTHDRRSKR